MDRIELIDLIVKNWDRIGQDIILYYHYKGVVEDLAEGDI